MSPLVMAALLSAFCALTALLLPAPEPARNRLQATGSELAVLCEAASRALTARAMARDRGEAVPALTRATLEAWLVPGFRAPENWQLARQGTQVFVWLAAPGLFPKNMGQRHGMCSNGRLGSLVLPGEIPDHALVCLAGEDAADSATGSSTVRSSTGSDRKIVH